MKLSNKRITYIFSTLCIIASFITNNDKYFISACIFCAAFLILDEYERK